MNYTWQQASKRWLTEMSHKRTISQDAYRFKKLSSRLDSKLLSEITREDIYEIMQQGELRENKSGTINRNLALIRSVLNKSYKEWGWLETPPIYIKLRKDSPGRTRWLSREEEGHLLSRLPKHLAYMAEFALATGQRKSNITNLKWTDIDLANKVWTIKASDFKNGREHSVPLNKRAINVLLLCKNRSDHVFLYNKKPVKEVSTKAFRDALKKSGIKDFKWHDLRHTWASRHVQAGTSLFVLQRLGGWIDSKSTQRYAHLNYKQLAEAAENIV